ncbi:MAG: aminodeoxychorismate synthase component I, partial [Bacteroidia bacterium]
MPIHLPSSIVQQMNTWGKAGTPFLFIIDFECQKPLLFPLHAVPPTIRFALPMLASKPHKQQILPQDITFSTQPLSLSEYQAAFDMVQYHLQHGDTYLLNLTMPTPINTN